MAAKKKKTTQGGLPKSAPVQQKTDQGIVDQVKSIVPVFESTEPGKRISRAQKEQKRRKQIYALIAAVSVVALLLLAGAALNQFYFKPNKVLASVEGSDIKRKDYWKYREFTLLSQANQYQQIASYSTGDQQSQYLALAQQANDELQNVWGSTDVDQDTLARMVDDQVYLHGLEAQGDPVTDQDVEDFILGQFQPANSNPINPESPTPTLIPERAAWATQTAQAALATPIPVDESGSPVAAEGSPVSGTASPAAGSPGAEAVASPAESTEASPTETAVVSSPAAIASPIPQASTPDASPEATLTDADARATAETSYDDYADQIFGQVHMSKSDYERLIIAPAVARQRVQEQVTTEVGQSADQVWASHILVETEDLANQIYDELQNGASFEQTAVNQSIDTATAANGGDLGWFPQGIMVPEFDSVVFAMQPGEISKPFQTQFGWHIVLVQDRDTDKALTDAQISQLVTARTTDWEETARASMDVSGVEPTPTSASVFAPPPGAPTVAPTALPTEILATPEAVQPEGSPTAAG